MLRSLTKTWALAGLRAGYALGSPALLARLAAPRPQWPVSTPALEAVIACCEPGRRRRGRSGPRNGWSPPRAEQAARARRRSGVTVLPGRAPFLLLRLPEGRGERVRAVLREAGVAVRRGDTFPGLGPDHLRVAVRPAAQVARLAAVLADALVEVGRMTATVADVIAALEAAYPPAAAADWDAVGLVCGDPDDRCRRCSSPSTRCPRRSTRRSTAGGAAQLLVTHHPLLLRGVHGVGADTPKGALVHRLIRARHARCSPRTPTPTPPTPASRTRWPRRSASTVDGPARAASRPSRSTRSSPSSRSGTADHRVHERAVRGGRRAIGNYSHCSFATAGTGQFRPLDGANPTIGAVGKLERVAETKLEMVLPRGLPGRPCVAALRAAHPYEEPAFDVLELADLPSARGLGRIGTLPAAEPLATFAERVAARAAGHGVGRAGRGRARPPRSQRVAVCGGAGDSPGRRDRAPASTPTSPPTCATTRPSSTCAAARACPALVDVAHWASRVALVRAGGGHRRRMALGGSVEVRVSHRCTDPWTVRPTGAMTRMG